MEISIYDTLNFRVQIFNKEGKFIGKFGKVGNRIGNSQNQRALQ